MVYVENVLLTFYSHSCIVLLVNIYISTENADNEYL